MTWLNPWPIAFAALLIAFLWMPGQRDALADPPAQPTPRQYSAEEQAELTRAKELYDRSNALFDARRYAEAFPLARQCHDIRKKLLGEEHADYGASVNDLAVLYSVTNDRTRAEPLYQQALAIRKKALGEEHPDYASTLLSLAVLYKQMGDYARAEPLYQQVLAIRKKALGEEHPKYTTNLNSLAHLYYLMGDYARAEPLYEQALTIRKRVLGEAHPDYADSLSHLAYLCSSMGDYSRAEPLYHEASAIYKKVLGEEHPYYASSLDNLARLYQSIRSYARAEPLFQQALAIRKKVLGEEHPTYAVSLTSMAYLHCAVGDYARAEPLYQQALAIEKKVLGEEHENYASTLNHLAVLYGAMGDYARVEPLYHQCLRIKKKTVGEEHPEYATILNNLASLYFSMGDDERAEPPARQAAAIIRQWMDRTFDVQSERQQIIMANKKRSLLDQWIVVAKKRPSEAIYAEVLAWKGAVTLRQQRSRLTRALEQTSDPAVAQTAQHYAELARQLATLVNRNTVPGDAGQQQRVDELSRSVEEAELAIVRGSATLRQQLAQARRTPAEIQQALPPEAALIDLLEYGHSTPPKKPGAEISRQRRLLAFVVRPDRPIARIDLGEVKPIQDSIDAWRESYGQRRGEQSPAEQLRRLLWEPLAEHLVGCATVLVCPDGAVSRIPWAALPADDPQKHQYLVEERAIAVLPVVQQLPELLAEEPAPQAPSLLCVGNVNYDADPLGRAVGASAASGPAGSNVLTGWTHLPGTRAEIDSIRKCFQQHFPQGKVQTLRDTGATEPALRTAASQYRYLHLATHGYFAPPALVSVIQNASQAQKNELLTRQDAAGYHPGLLSGIALSGANQAGDADDGLLTALEVGELSLSGVDLATLSACETGLGETAGGEGVLGLQRAFQVAGARTVVASLWSVSDDATRALMSDFYDNLWNKKLTKIEALRQAQLSMLRTGTKRGLKLIEDQPRQQNRLPPFYWAAFVLSGDPF